MKGGGSMSEQQGLSSGVHADDTGAVPAGADAEVFEITAGTYLRQSREAAGMHLATMAAALKVSVSKLEALEADQYDLLPSPVFTRALACSVCRMLKLDSVPVLERLPAIGPTRYVPKDGLNESFRPRNAGPAPSVWTQISRPAVLAGMVFLLGALVLIFLPTMQYDGPAENATPSAVVNSNLPQEPASDAAPGSEVTTGDALPATAAPAGIPAALVPASAASAASIAAPVAPVAPNPAAIASFKTSAESWVNVTDAKGVVVFNRTMGVGESAEVSGALPLSVVVGRADVTQVQIRGQAFDLGTVSKSNVARFEVK